MAFSHLLNVALDNLFVSILLDPTVKGALQHFWDSPVVFIPSRKTPVVQSLIFQCWRSVKVVYLPPNSKDTHRVVIEQPRAGLTQVEHICDQHQVNKLENRKKLKTWTTAKQEIERHLTQKLKPCWCWCPHAKVLLFLPLLSSPLLCTQQICLPPSVDLLCPETCFQNSFFLSQALFLLGSLLSPAVRTLRSGANRTTWKQGHASLSENKNR